MAADGTQIQNAPAASGTSIPMRAYLICIRFDLAILNCSHVASIKLLYWNTRYSYDMG